MGRTDVRHVWVLAWTAAVFVVTLFAWSNALAQNLPGSGQSLSLELDPQYPAPQQNVTVSLASYSLDTTGASIVWYVDGERVAVGDNQRSVIVAAGKLGERKTVRAVIVQRNGAQTSTSVAVTPAVVDIILEADTYVPQFYQGRALPSQGSRVRAIAVVHTGTDSDPRTYTYHWMQNTATLFGGPIRGKNVAEITMPRYRDDYLILDVYDNTGRKISRSSISLNPIDMQLAFYEDNPLRGMSRKAIGEYFMLVGEESTVRAAPYFMDTDLTEATTQFEWRLNGLPATSGGDQSKITLRKQGEGGGQAQVDLSLILKRTVPQYLTGSFIINFR